MLLLGPSNKSMQFDSQANSMNFGQLREFTFFWLGINTVLFWSLHIASGTYESLRLFLASFKQVNKLKCIETASEHILDYWNEPWCNFFIRLLICLYFWINHLSGYSDCKFEVCTVLKNSCNNQSQKFCAFKPVLGLNPTLTV